MNHANRRLERSGVDAPGVNGPRRRSEVARRLSTRNLVNAGHERIRQDQTLLTREPSLEPDQYGGDPWDVFENGDSRGEPSSSQVASPSSDSAWLYRHASKVMRPGDVLLHAPSHVFQAPGGGENQLIRTANGLEALGYPVRPLIPWTDRIERARLLHLFGMSREGLELARVARARRIPLVLSPICWSESSCFWMRGVSFFRRSREAASWLARTVSPFALGWRAELLSLADVILPNSLAESRQLVRLYGADPSRITTVPNGVDLRFANADPGQFQSVIGRDDFVLYVGRIEPRKNVLGLILALKRTGYPLVVIGDTAPGHELYVESCRNAGRDRVRWLPRLDHADGMLASAFAAARVFALPSFFETPGLAALEAASAGRAIVITPNGCTREYFGDRVHYARPHRIREITHAVESAWNRGPHPELAEHVVSHYSWSEVARRTADVYDQLSR